jgi:RimJ/RimL family protein N-acetyltransferase
MHLAPITLTGEAVRLEPLSLDHHAALCQVGLDPSIWRWTSVRIATPEEMRRYIEDALRLRDAGTALPFATVDRASERVVGCTRYGNIDRDNRKLEIGWTFVAPAWQRTRINTEAKYLMLRHAFETLGCIRVELKTDALNEKSRRAIARTGAREEGTLRHHMICADGRYRDTVYYSVIAPEWPAVKAALETKLGGSGMRRPGEIAAAPG